MNFLVDCSDLNPIVQLLKAVIKIIQWGIPIVLIIFIIIDLAKAAIASKEDEMKKAQDLAIKRAIYALVIFLVPWLVGVVFGLLGDVDDDAVGVDAGDKGTIMQCWNYKKK